MRRCKLGDIADIITGPFGSQLHASDYVEKGIPSIMPKDIGDRKVIEDTIAYISEKDAERLAKYRVRLGDIVYSRRGDIERCALIREENVGALCGTGCLRVRPDNNIIDSIFLSFYLSSPEIRKWVVSNATGATMPNLNTDVLSRLPMELPALKVQRRIGTILDAFDKKIALNNHLNATLEAMAKTLYDYWFVQFDFPDKKGRPYKTSGGKMVYNEELGREIPAGWEVKRLLDIATLFDSERIPLSSKEREVKKGTIPYYGATGVLDYVDEAIFDGVYLLIAEDGSVEMPNGSLVLQYIWGKSWINNHAHILQGTSPYSTEYLYLALRYIKTKQLMTGSIQKKVTQDNLKNIKLACPSNPNVFIESQIYNLSATDKE